MLSKKINFKVLTLVLLVINITQFCLLSFFGIRNNQYKLKQSVSITPIMISSLTPSPTYKNPSHTNWKIYTNDKFGFSIKYPSDLNLIPKEIDIKSDYNEYERKCETGIYSGCGGGRWPDFKISFLRQNGNAAFDVRIYQLPSSAYVGGIERDSFTYLIQAFRFFDEDIKLEPLNSNTLADIQATLQFYNPTKPVACLWEHTLLGPGFDPIKDKNYIEENKGRLSQITGYSFDSSINSCIKISYYTWSGQIETDKPPFDTLDKCLLSCSR